MAWYNGGAWGGLPIARLYEILVDIQNKVNDRLDGDVSAPVTRAFPCAREVKAFAQEVLDVLTAEAERTTPFTWVTTDGGETAVDLEFLGLDGFSLAGFERPQQVLYWATLREAIGKLRYKKRVVSGSGVDSYCTGRLSQTTDATQTQTSPTEPSTWSGKESVFSAKWGELADVEVAMGAANAGGTPEAGTWSTGGPATMAGARRGQQSLAAGEPVGGTMTFLYTVAGGVRQHGGLRFGVGGLEDVTKRRFTWALTGDAAEEVDTSAGTLEHGDTTVETGEETYEITLESALVRAAVEEDATERPPYFGEDMNENWIAGADWLISLEAELECSQLEVWQDLGAV